jgi:hypothetical protein
MRYADLREAAARTNPIEPTIRRSTSNVIRERTSSLVQNDEIGMDSESFEPTSTPPISVAATAL